MNVNHGIAIAKSSDIINIEKGEKGVITAYLPEMEKFAVMFEKDKWITFTGNEEWFLNNFKVIQE